ncbi:DUF3592 domain-containing protein [uncultured Cetobacterium sp.]|uniref:DUF3592 domain-containing protein n=1 Tax=uncultured Cetobacterium sp. TaxID=527638 RepID=UPI00262AF402|nr:DUF3592 domain-containing protein [uncultured Cetobacterium sp.]
MKFLFKTVIPITLAAVLIPQLFFLIFFLIGLFLIKKYFSDKKSIYEIILGTVIEIKENISKGTSNGHSYKRIYYSPIFEYIYKENSYQIGHAINTNINGKSTFFIGQKVELRIYPNTPDKAILNTNFSTNILLYAGLAFIIIPMIIMLVFLKGGLLNFHSIGERFQNIFSFFDYLISKIIRVLSK